MPETQSTRRLLWLLRALICWGVVIFLRLIWLQVLHHDDLLKQAQSQQQKVVPIQAQRGSILDRTGQPLAKSLPAESVLVNPKRIRDAAVAAHLLAPIMGLDSRHLEEKIRIASLRDLGFLWVKRKVTADEAERVRSYRLEYVEFKAETRRFYPHGQLASHVVGTVGIANPNETIERGTAGIEMSLDDDLAGTPGQMRVFNDVKQNSYDSVIGRRPEPGADIVLTIDQNLQYAAEKEIERAAKASGAKSGSIVVMNPYNGEILAMANYPTFDPNEPPGPGEATNARSNLAISTPFEPGSVFKVITLAAALETTKLGPESMINCGNGTLNLMGRVIHDHVRGVLSMADVLAHSSNIGAIQIGLKVGNQQLYRYVRRFGFGRKTGIDLPGESPGILRKVEHWTPTSIASVSMGQEVGVTSLQLALAGAAVANGGMLVKPKLVLARQKKGEPMERFADEPADRAIQPETAILMRQMMEGVVLRGTQGKLYATIKGYTSGGKTGSAQIFDSKAHLYTHNYNASFLGFAPVTNPQIVVAVTLHDTKNGNAGFGGPVAGPVFSKVAMTALRMLDVPKDNPHSSSPVPAPVGADANLLVADAGGSRVVSSVTQPPVQADSSAPSEESKLSSPDRRPFLESSLVGPKVPNFQGMTLRGVLEASAASGVQIEVLGNGLARKQEPRAGSILAPGARVRVQFTR